MAKKETIIISLGGSLIVPDELDINFLNRFRSILMKHIKRGKRFVVVTGGGHTSRRYQNAVKELKDTTDFESDLVGIEATRLNGSLVKLLFKGYVHPEVVDNPTRKIRFNKQILIAAGWKPGCSTDNSAVLIANNLGIKKILNLSNIDYVYDKDPKLFKDAKPIKSTSWNEFRKILPPKWTPKLNSPFDPTAAKSAEKLGIGLAVMNGKNLKNLENYLSGKPFVGTVIG